MVRPASRAARRNAAPGEPAREAATPELGAQRDASLTEPLITDRPRVVRIYHGGRSAAQRARERALAAAGVDLTLVVPARWTEPEHEAALTPEPFEVRALAVRRPGDVNRHAYADARALEAVLREVAPDLLDVHEEPFSAAARQWLEAAGRALAVVMYAAQNVDKRYPPPFAQYERSAYRRVDALYPCSRQAASVARGKGFAGPIVVLPLGYDDTLFSPGEQSLDDEEVVLGLFGRLVPEKGVADAVEILRRVSAARPARLVVVGHGPERHVALTRAEALGVRDRLEILPWLPAAELAGVYRRTHVVLVPSRPTETWVEQFGRVIVEAQASGAVVAGYASGAIPEVGGDPAVLTDVGDVHGLGDRIAALVSDASAFGVRRAQGIELARGRTWARVAARHVDLYRRVLAGDVGRLELPRSPRRRRRVARAELGPTSATTGGARPFALPFLRRGGVVPAALAAVLDLVAEASSRLPARSRAGQPARISR